MDGAQPSAGSLPPRTGLAVMFWMLTALLSIFLFTSFSSQSLGSSSVTTDYISGTGFLWQLKSVLTGGGELA